MHYIIEWRLMPVQLLRNMDSDEAVHHLAFDLPYHFWIPEVNLADVNGAQFITPLSRLGRDLLAHGSDHGMPIHQHLGQRQIAQASDCGVAHVGRQRPAWIRILKPTFLTLLMPI